MLEWLATRNQENERSRAILNAVRYFCASGGLAELVDCTGLENRRAERYRGFESLSLRSKRLLRRALFLCP